MNTLFVKTKSTLPIKAHATDAGLDLCATEDITLWLNKPTLDRKSTRLNSSHL